MKVDGSLGGPSKGRCRNPISLLGSWEPMGWEGGEAAGESAVRVAWVLRGPVEDMSVMRCWVRSRRRCDWVVSRVVDGRRVVDASTYGIQGMVGNRGLIGSHSLCVTPALLSAGREFNRVKHLRELSSYGGEGRNGMG